MDIESSIVFESLLFSGDFLPKGKFFVSKKDDFTREVTFDSRGEFMSSGGIAGVRNFAGNYTIPFLSSFNLLDDISKSSSSVVLEPSDRVLMSGLQVFNGGDWAEMDRYWRDGDLNSSGLIAGQLCKYWFTERGLLYFSLQEKNASKLVVGGIVHDRAVLHCSNNIDFSGLLGLKAAVYVLPSNGCFIYDKSFVFLTPYTYLRFLGLVDDTYFFITVGFNRWDDSIFEEDSLEV